MPEVLSLVEVGLVNGQVCVDVMLAEHRRLLPEPLLGIVQKLINQQGGQQIHTCRHGEAENPKRFRIATKFGDAREAATFLRREGLNELFVRSE